MALYLTESWYRVAFFFFFGFKGRHLGPSVRPHPALDYNDTSAENDTRLSPARRTQDRYTGSTAHTISGDVLREGRG